MNNTKASIITIGDELLIGQVIDTNSAWIAQRLNEIGIIINRRVAVGDTKLDIIKALDEELQHSTIVLITGGLGPTADDVTKPLLCEYFGGNLVVNEDVLAHVKNLFSRLDRPMLETNLKQAEVPDTCTVLFNKKGTAPGMWFEKDGKAVIAMPGVPFEMMSIMQDEVIERLRLRYTGSIIEHRNIITAGEGESFVAERIKDIEASLPDFIKLAYLPANRILRLRLTATGEDRQQLSDLLEKFHGAIAHRLSDIVVSLDDIPMQEVLGKLLLEKGLTLGFAESCTGGYLGHLITQVTGSGSYFKGSLVTYDNEVKENLLGISKKVLDEQTAVSEDVAIQMAKSAIKLLDCDVSLSVTGILSAGGEENDINPVGTVWMAVARKNEVKTHKFYFPYDRLRNKDVAVQMGMLMLWKFLNDKL
jgi:nicotinamide-nucleotide amidase